MIVTLMTAVSVQFVVGCVYRTLHQNIIYEFSYISLVAVDGLYSAVSMTQSTTCAKKVPGLTATSAAWKSGIACCHPLMRYQHWQKDEPSLNQMASSSDGQATCHILA